MSKIFHLVYVSKAHDDLSYTDIQAILDTSRIHNSAHDITGLLVLRDGYFMQVLEGDEDRIRRLMVKIKADDRNSNISVLLETWNDERLFADWSMAFVDGDLSHNETEDLVNLSDVLLAKFKPNQELIMLALKAFQGSQPALG
jgi:Sensors of blue-light using FAD.